MSDLERWLPYRRPKPSPALRLFCFPYAGGSASAFRGWSEKLPEELEVCAVQLPGRERRMGESAYTRMEPLIEELVRVLEPVLDLSFAFFGHSMGGKVAYELALALRREGRPSPRLMIASGSRPPFAAREIDPIHGLPDDELIAELRELGGTPKEVLENDELMRLLLPLLRSDFELNETYDQSHPDAPTHEPFRFPVAAYAGKGDAECPPETVEQWQQITEGPFRLRIFDGGHFFLHDVPDEVVSALRRDLAAL